MYLPTHFALDDPQQLQALMRAHPLASLVSGAGATLTADHIPLEYDPSVGAHGLLRGHVARANPLWHQAADAPVLAIFSGPQAYVSPSWYPSKAQTHKVVPTWDYAVVHAQGRLRVVDDPVWVLALVTRLTQAHEAGQAKPWSVADAPADYVQQMLRAIVGIEIPVERLVGKWKVSQNRSEADRHGVAAALEAQAAPAASSAMAALVRAGTAPPDKA